MTKRQLFEKAIQLIIESDASFESKRESIDSMVNSYNFGKKIEDKVHVEYHLGLQDFRVREGLE